MFCMQQYLIPQARENTGIDQDKVTIDEDVLSMLIKSYCRESGVRSLQKHIEKVSEDRVTFGF